MQGMAGLFDEVIEKVPQPPAVEMTPELRRAIFLRKSCLILRFCYYCLDESLVTDPVYDARERELKQLLEAHPELDALAPFGDICPTKVPGSSYASDYPDYIEWQGRRMLVEHQRYTNVL